MKLEKLLGRAACSIAFVGSLYTMGCAAPKEHIVVDIGGIKIPYTCDLGDNTYPQEHPCYARVEKYEERQREARVASSSSSGSSTFESFGNSLSDRMDRYWNSDEQESSRRKGKNVCIKK